MILMNIATLIDFFNSSNTYIGNNKERREIA